LGLAESVDEAALEAAARGGEQRRERFYRDAEALGHRACLGRKEREAQVPRAPAARDVLREPLRAEPALWAHSAGSFDFLARTGRTRGVSTTSSTARTAAAAS